MNIKELSKQVGVSEQALRSWCKRNGVRKESESETKGKRASYILTESDIEQIKEYYTTKGKQEKESKKGNESKTLDILAEQLKEKDRQISNLLQQLQAKDEQLAQLNDRLTAAQALHAGTIQTLKEQPQPQTETAAEQPTAEQSEIERITKELQELKAENEKKEQTQEQLKARIKDLETAAAASETSRTTSEPQAQKKSFFARIFRRK